MLYARMCTHSVNRENSLFWHLVCLRRIRCIYICSICIRCCPLLLRLLSPSLLLSSLVWIVKHRFDAACEYRWLTSAVKFGVVGCTWTYFVVQMNSFRKLCILLSIHRSIKSWKKIFISCIQLEIVHPIRQFVERRHKPQLPSVSPCTP